MKYEGLINISNEEYHAEQGHFSASRLKKALHSLADFNNYQPIGWKDYFDVGSAFEVLLCDPASFGGLVSVYDENQRPEPEKTFGSKMNKEWKEDFFRRHSHNLIISAEDLKIIHAMVESCLKDPLISEFIRGGQFQSSVFWTDKNGLPVKTRPDVIYRLGNDKVVNIDIKSIYKQSEFPFQMRKLNYPFQMVMQVLGLESVGYDVENCFWLAVEKTDNPQAVLYSFTKQQIQEMKDIYYATSARVTNAITSNYFPTYYQENANEVGAIELDLEDYFNYLNNK